MLTLTPIAESEFEQVFDLLKLCLFDVIDEVFGWDDEFQRQRLKDDYHWSWMYWVKDQNSTLGLVCYKPIQQALHLHLILLYPNYQGLGFGTKIMALIESKATDAKRDVTVTAFKKNLGAIALYQKLGYVIEQQEEHFLKFRLPYSQDLT